MGINIIRSYQKNVMIKFTRQILDNGMRVIINEDRNTPLVAMNVLYDVGARDENPEKTGFAHLFEHLMFGGSANVPVYDEPLELAGGSNNAFTTNDLTNYYLLLPGNNIEIGFWLESDRMLELDFSTRSLDVQRNVVIEEFRQRYQNQPYGDVWLLLRPLAYKVHPYRWPTIGMTMDHIIDATIDDVKDFFYRYYAPNNAILTLSGNISHEQGMELSRKWFGNIPKRDVKKRIVPQEPHQKEERKLEVERDVPFDAIYKAYHMCARNDKQYYTIDLLSDILANGQSARLPQQLVQSEKIFYDINAFITGDVDNGLFIIAGKLRQGKTIEEAEKALHEEINKLSEKEVEAKELEKVKNKFASKYKISNSIALDKAMRLGYFELIGTPDMVNEEINNYNSVNPLMIKSEAARLFNPSNCSTLYYRAKR